MPRIHPLVGKRVWVLIAWAKVLQVNKNQTRVKVQFEDNNIVKWVSIDDIER